MMNIELIELIIGERRRRTERTFCGKIALSTEPSVPMTMRTTSSSAEDSELLWNTYHHAHTLTIGWCNFVRIVHARSAPTCRTLSHSHLRGTHDTIRPRTSGKGMQRQVSTRHELFFLFSGNLAARRPLAKVHRFSTSPGLIDRTSKRKILRDRRTTASTAAETAKTLAQ